MLQFAQNLCQSSNCLQNQGFWGTMGKLWANCEGDRAIDYQITNKSQIERFDHLFHGDRLEAINPQRKIKSGRYWLTIPRLR
jgi:hypothetical protein